MGLSRWKNTLSKETELQIFFTGKDPLHWSVIKSLKSFDCAVKWSDRLFERFAVGLLSVDVGH